MQTRQTDIQADRQTIQTSKQAHKAHKHRQTRADGHMIIWMFVAPTTHSHTLTNRHTYYLNKKNRKANRWPIQQSDKQTRNK